MGSINSNCGGLRPDLRLCWVFARETAEFYFSPPTREVVYQNVVLSDLHGKRMLGVFFYCGIKLECCVWGWRGERACKGNVSKGFLEFFRNLMSKGFVVISHQRENGNFGFFCKKKHTMLVKPTTTILQKVKKNMVFVWNIIYQGIFQKFSGFLSTNLLR